MTAYQEALRRARGSIFRLGTTTEARLYRRYADVVEAVLAFQEGGVLTKQQAARLNRLLKEQLRGFVKDANAAVALGVVTTVDRVVRAHTAAVEQLLVREGIHFSPQWDRVATRTRFAMAEARGGVTDFRSLLKYQLEEKRLRVVDTAINSALELGTSTTSFTRQLARVLAADNPRVLALLPAKARRDMLAEAGAQGVEQAAAAAEEATAIRTLLSDARRIAVSEINNALRASNAAAMIEGGIVAATKWTLNSRHEGLRSSPDECDDLAEADDFDLGPGWYPPEEWPDAPHPYCGCYQGDVQLLPVADWGQNIAEMPEAEAA